MGKKISPTLQKARQETLRLPRLIELKIVLGVVVGDVLNHAAQQFAVVRQQALLHIITQQIAENATEVLVTRIAEERTAVGEHAHEA